MDLNVEYTLKVSSDRLNLKNTNINGVEYSIEITNYNENLGIFFYSTNVNEDFSILIGKGIALRRRINRPNHDHDDQEYLQIPEKIEWAKDRVNVVDFGTRTSKL